MLNRSLGPALVSTENHEQARSSHVPSINALRQCRNALNNQVLLAAMLNGLQTESSIWMDGLVSNCLQSILDRKLDRKRQFQSEMAKRKAATEFVDKIVEILQILAMQFNFSAGQELNISCTGPTLVTEVNDNNCTRVALETRTYYRARLSSRFWSLVVRNQLNLVEFILMPASRVIGLSRREMDYEPLLRVFASIRNDELVFETDQQILKSNKLEALSRDLFARLVECTRQSLSQANNSAEETPFFCDRGSDDTDAMPGKVSNDICQPVPNYCSLAGSTASTLTSDMTEGDLLQMLGQSVMTLAGEAPVALLPQPDQPCIEAKDCQSIVRFLQVLADTVQQEFCAQQDSPNPNFVLQEKESMLNMMNKKISPALAYLVGDAEAAVESAIRGGMQAFEQRDFLAVEESCKQALLRSEILKRIGLLEKEWIDLAGVADSCGKEESGGVYGVSLAADLIIDCLDQLLAHYSTNGCRSFELRDFSSVKELCDRARPIHEFSLRASAIFADYRESKRDELRLLVSA